MGEDIAFNTLLGSDRFRFKQVSRDADWDKAFEQSVDTQSDSSFADLDRALMTPCCPESAKFSPPMEENKDPKIFQFFPIGNEGFDFSTMKIMDDETTGPSGMGFDQSTAALWVASGFEPTEPRQLLRRFPNWQTPDLEQALVMFDKGKGGVSGLYIWIAKGTPIDLQAMLPVITQGLFGSSDMAKQHETIDILTAELSSARLPRTFPDLYMVDNMYQEKNWFDKDTFRYLGNITAAESCQPELDWKDVGASIRLAASAYGNPIGLVPRSDDSTIIPVRTSFLGAVDVTSVVNGDKVVDLKSYIPPLSKGEGRKKWRGLIFSKARRNNRSSDNNFREWEFAFQKDLIPSGSFLSLESFFWVTVPLEFSRLAFWGGKRDAFILRPLTTDYEFAVNLISASILEQWLILASKKWWNQGKWLLDSNWSPPTGIFVEQEDQIVDLSPETILSLFCQKIQAFACEDFPLATWDVPVDLTTDRQGKTKVLYHVNLARMEDLPKDLCKPVSKYMQNDDSQTWDWFVTEDYPNPDTKPSVCIDWIWNDFQDVVEFITQAWGKLKREQIQRMKEVAKLREALSALKEAEMDLPFIARWLPRANMPWENCRLSWSVWMNTPQVTEFLKIAKASMKQDGDWVASGAPGGVSWFVNNMLVELRQRLEILKSTGRGNFTLIAEADHFIRQLEASLSDTVFGEVKEAPTQPGDWDVLTAKVAELRLQRKKAVVVKTCPSEPLADWFKNKIRELQTQALVPTRLSVGSSMVPFVINEQLQPGKSSAQIASSDPAPFGFPTSRRVDSVTLQLSRVEAFYDHAAVEDVENAKLVNRLILAVDRMEVSTTGKLVLGDPSLFSVMHDSPLIKWMTQKIPALRKRPPTNAQGYPDFPDKTVARFPVTKQILSFAARRLFTREWTPLELSMTGLPHATPVFHTDASQFGVPPTAIPGAPVRFFAKNGSSFAKRKTINISIFVSSGDGSLDQQWFFGRPEGFMNWDSKDFDLRSEDGALPFEVNTPLSFFDPRVGFPQRQNYQEWLKLSRVTKELSLARTRDMREKLKKLVKSFNERGITPIFWCYSSAASFAVMNALDVSGLDGRMDSTRGGGGKFIIQMFKSPDPADLRLLANRYHMNVNRSQWKSASDFVDFEPIADQLLNKLFPRSMTSMVVLGKRARPMQVSVPYLNEAFLTKGPWLQFILQKGAIKTSWDESLTIDQYIASAGPEPAVAHKVPDRIRMLSFPQTQLTPGDLRLQAAEEVAMGLRRGQDKSAAIARLLKLGTFREPTIDNSKTYVVKWHGKMEHQGPFTFEEMSQLPICSPIPVGQGKFLAGATVPMARPAWNLDERDSIPDASALMELARPWRGSSDPHWQDRREAKYFHPESKSAYCMITSQSWMAMSQLEESEAKPGLDVAVALIPSAKIWLGTERGPTAKNCFWDWPAFWGAYNGFTAQARQGLFHGNHYFWLTMEGRYLAALFRRVMDQNGRNIAFKGLTGTHVHSTLWKVWDPMIAVKLPLQASMALFLKHAKAKTVAAAECWKERSHIQSFHSRWLDPSAPINRSAPLVFTPQPNVAIQCCATKQKDTPIFASAADYDQLLVPPALSPPDWICPLDLDDVLRTREDRELDQAMAKIPRTLLVSELVLGFRPFASLPLMKKQLIMGAFCNPAWQIGRIPMLLDEDRSNPEKVLPFRLARLAWFLRKPNSVAQWRASVLAWSSVEIKRLTRWVEAMTQIIPILEIKDSKEGQEILQPAEAQFWHPVWAVCDDDILQE